MPAVHSNIKNKSKEIKNLLKHFKDLTKNPEVFLSVQPKKSEQIKNLLKEIYGISIKNAENDESDCGDVILPELVLDGLDEDQIWQQIEIRNNAVWSKFLEKTSKFLAIKDEGFILNCVDENNLIDSQENSEDSEENASDLDELHDEDDIDDYESEQNRKSKKSKKKMRTSIVDDKFFKLAELEEFLIQEDRKEELRQRNKFIINEEDEIDYFEDLSENDEENAKYLEFFDEEEVELSQESLAENRRKHLKKRKNSGESESVSESGEENEEVLHGKIRKDSENGSEIESEDNDDNDSGDGQEILNDDGSDAEELVEEEDEVGGEAEDAEEEGNQRGNDDGSTGKHDRENQTKSSFEEKQDRLKKRIEEYEESRFEEKPWQLKGEITATSRPQNSLLEEVLEFDAATRPAPIITEETTLRLEDIIKQRIKDKAWDDVERKYKPIQTPQEFRKKLVLDQEKSKESLAQIYEKEYHTQLEKLNPDNNNIEEEPKKHKEIRELMKTLFTKLDALSNFHYTPKPVAPEPKIITNTPALNMEEVAPVAVSDANLLAPEEIKNRPKGDILGKSERQKTDKKRERRKKKLHQKLLHKRQEEKEAVRQQLGLKPTKKEEKDKNLKNVIKHRNVQKADINSESISTFKSSKSFFSTLQDKTTMLKRNAEKPRKEGITAKKMKL